jgi:AAA ATPase domain
MALPCVPHAAHNSGREDAPSLCLEGTRVAILEEISSWWESANGERPPVYWLSGLAGIGKSTIAKTVAERAEEKGVLGASFFFSRSDKPLRDPVLVLPTLAFQLAHSDSVFKKVFKDLVVEALRRDPTVGRKDLWSQLKELILNPLLNISPPPHPVLVILDALDECEEEGAARILSLVFKHLAGIPFLRILITSRPQPHLSSVFNEAPNLVKTVLHDIEASVIQQDIHLYISTELARISQKFNLAVPAKWPTDAERNSLVEKCGKLFVYAATAIRFIGNDRARDPRRYLRLILDTETLRKSRVTPYSHLDGLYMEVLCSSLPPYNDEEILTRFQIVVGSIVVLREPLPLHSLANFVQYETYVVEACLSHLHSVIIPPSNAHEAPRIYHPSFLEFITDPSRCSMPEFVIVPKPEQELRHTVRCFELMGTHLKRDIAGISDPSLLNKEVDGFAEKVSEALLPEVQYACRYWASHLLCVEFGERRLMEALEGFSKRSILWWFEAMSLLGNVTNAVRSIEEAYRWAVSVFPIDR